MSRAVILLALLTVFTYRPLRSAEFVYEDEFAITTAPQVLTPNDVEPWHPRWLTQATEQATVLIAGISPFAFHAGNLALHLLNGVLLLVLARQLGWSTVGSLTALLIFWLNPLASEAVSYASGRTDLILCLGVLITLLAASAAAPSELTRLGVVVGLLIAWGGKETGACAALLLVLLWIVLPEYRPERRWWIPIFLVGCAGTAFVLRPIVNNPYAWQMPHGGLGYLSIQLTAMWRLLALLVYPVGFTIDHDFYRVTEPLGLTVLAMTVILSVVVYRLKERLPWVTLSAFWVLVALAPRFFVRIPEFLHEQHMYTALVGVSLLAGWTLSTLLSSLTDTSTDLLIGAGDPL